MIHNALRKELAALLDDPKGYRNPAIRRSRDEAWLYATDVPGLNNGTVPDPLIHALTEHEWEYIQDGDWLLLRKAAPEPPEDWYDGPFGPEAACCLSLIERHQEKACEPSDAEQRMMIKAGEEGSRSYENTCAALHREWAERLRDGKALPFIDRRYFKA